MQLQEKYFQSSDLITGGSGLVGSSLSGGMKPSSKELNLLSPTSTIEWFEDKSPKRVVHCAGRVGGIKANMEKKATFFRENILMSLNLLEACRVYKVEKVVSFLSTCIFPDKAVYPLTPAQITSGPPHSSNYGYAYAKRMLHIQSMAYREEYGMNIVSLIPCNIYGPHDNFNLQTSHVLPALIHKFYLAKKNDEDVEIWGTGKEKREFLFSQDLNDIITWALDEYEDETPLIVSPEEEYEIGEVVQIIKEEFDFSGTIFYNGEMSGQLRKPSDSTKFYEIATPNLTPIDVGIRKTVKWFVQNYKKARI